VNLNEFDTLMNIVYSRWGAKSYPTPVKERIWYFVKELPQRSFETIIYALLDTSRYAPMPQEFKMLAYGEKDRLGLRKSKEIESKPSAEAKCWDCADGGNLFTRHRTKGTSATFRCHCQAGGTRSDAQGSRWSNAFAGTHVIEPIYTKGLGDWSPDAEKKLDDMVDHMRAVLRDEEHERQRKAGSLLPIGRGIKALIGDDEGPDGSAA